MSRVRRRLNDSSLNESTVLPAYALADEKEAPATPPNDLRRRRQARSADLLDAVVAMDTATDPAERDRLLKWIVDAYAARGGGVLLGLFGRCYLGDPYVDHRMSVTADILEHYRSSDFPPVEYHAARPLAQSPHYLYIEVYADGQVVPVRADGTPAI